MKKVFVMFTMLFALVSFTFASEQRSLTLGLSFPSESGDTSIDNYGLDDFSASGFAANGQLRLIQDNKISWLFSLDIGYLSAKFGTLYVNYWDNNNVERRFDDRAKASGFGSNFMFGIGYNIVENKHISLVVSGIVGSNFNILSGTTKVHNIYDSYYNRNVSYSFDRSLTTFDIELGVDGFISYKFNDTFWFSAGLTLAHSIIGFGSAEYDYYYRDREGYGHVNSEDDSFTFSCFTCIPRIGVTLKI